MSDAKLYRVVEVTEPGVLAEGRYMAVRSGVVILEVELDVPTRPKDLIPTVRTMAGDHSTEGGEQ